MGEDVLYPAFASLIVQLLTRPPVAQRIAIDRPALRNRAQPPFFDSGCGYPDVGRLAFTSNKTFERRRSFLSFISLHHMEEILTFVEGPGSQLLDHAPTFPWVRHSQRGRSR